MDFTDAPHLADHLHPGMYALHEQAVCRRHASGDQPWNWNVGVVSPPLSSGKAICQ
jgi:para-nitrobenzyl esterase